MTPITIWLLVLALVNAEIGHDWAAVGVMVLALVNILLLTWATRSED